MKRLLLSVMFLATACSHGAFGPGPLAPIENGTSMTGLPANPGQAVTFANNWIGDQVKQVPTFKVLSIGLVDPTPGLMVVAVGVRDARYTSQVANGEPFPPKARLHALPFETSRPLNIVIGVKAAKEGHCFAKSIWFIYEVDGKTYRATEASGVHLCVPLCFGA